MFLIMAGKTDMAMALVMLLRKDEKLQNCVLFMEVFAYTCGMQVIDCNVLWHGRNDVLGKLSSVYQ